MRQSTYEWHSIKRTEVWLLGALGMMAAGICLFVLLSGRVQDRETRWALLGFALVFGFAGVATFIDRKTCINVPERTVRCDALLLSRFRLWSRNIPFDAFKAVVVRRFRGAEDIGYTYMIGLRRQNGRRIWVRYESSEALADSCAQRLSCDTGLARDETEV